MAKVFTITEGLENMGALKTGGQGSIYKARRPDGTISAVKLMPTPLLSESADDKHYLDFKNEVEKLWRVNEQHNPNIVRILSAGVTDTGSFPYIEMEFIEGPDLCELLQPPHPPVFPLKEALRVAEHLSGALAHCHSLGVKHGDIKSNNIKLDTRTGNYVLLDFGLAVMSDEQRRTSLRHAGAIEFMAPEQNEGQMLFPTDVYSFGVVLFELLAGRVPFPLNGQGETARNAVMLAHMEEPVPDVLSLRYEHLPEGWSREQKLQELQLPPWLLHTLERCLQKRPEDRFGSAVELHDHLVQHLATWSPELVPPEEAEQVLSVLQSRNEELARRNAELEQQLNRIKEEPPVAAPLGAGAMAAAPASGHTETASTYSEPPRRRSGMSPALVLLLILVVGGGIAGYTLLKHNKDEGTAVPDVQSYTDTTTTTDQDEEYTSPQTVYVDTSTQLTDTAVYEAPAPVTDTFTPMPLEVPQQTPKQERDTTAQRPPADSTKEPTKDSTKEKKDTVTQSSGTGQQ